MSYRNNKQIVYAADPLAQRFSVNFDGKKPVAKRDDEGDHIAIDMLIMAQNTQLAAKGDGPEHGRKPQKREITVLVNAETREPIMTPFKENVTVTKDDQVIRTLTAHKGGGGQLALVELEKVENLQEAIDDCLPELAAEATEE